MVKIVTEKVTLFKVTNSEMGYVNSNHFKFLSRVISIPKFFTGLYYPRNYCEEKKEGEYGGNSESPEEKKGGKYKIFRDEDAPVIFDVEEERNMQRYEFEASPVVDEFEGLNLNRGERGVFEIEDLVEVLRKDNAKNIFVVKLPQELGYVDHLVVASGKSRHHLVGMAEYIKKVYKKKKSSTDVIPRSEGENLSQWIALDLGNIAVHLMSNEARQKYDLESLWSLGPIYDPQTVDNTRDNALHELLKKHSVTLDDFQPSNRLS